ncbi:coiled-coil domain-containing protein 73 [Elgaria multicarinata webbii]|uniref:coiled-coil domain-containing protein 73 n=1 Tax=Elgaria multicarinata webbii TaxID=159646 RepID=UPI002FCCF017
MDESLNKEAPAYIFQNSSEAMLSIQRLDFKTSFLEAVEELRMRRDAEIHYEEQISKFVLEKQELEWQKEALQHEKEALSKQHTEAMTAFKKQFQARMFAMEEEKGKYLLAKESKEREIEGLKETLKTLQISKYTLQKKLNEMEQKLQLYMLAKEDHQNSLNEFEKCHAVIMCQFGLIKGSHERLEQNVVEAIQLNKKLTEVNKRQESEMHNLKEELKKVTANLIRSNVSCQHRVGEENLNLTAKEQELQELRQKHTMETELNRKITEENAHLKGEKQEMIASLQHMQQLLCRLTETNVRMEMELNGLKDKWQALERDNELQREKAKENEEKFLNLQNECETTQVTWKNQANDTSNESQMHMSKKENKYTQTAEVSNNLEQEEPGVKNTLSCSLNSDEIQTQQNNADMNTEKDTSHSVEGMLEICMNENDTVHTFKKNQRETSEGQALCTVDFITPGLSCGSSVAQSEETAAKGKVDKEFFNKIQARIEMKSSASCNSLGQFPVDESKMLLDSVHVLDHLNPDTDYGTKHNKQLQGGVTNEFVSEVNENTNYTLHEGASSTSETLSKESKIQDNSTNEKATNNYLETEIDSILSQTTESDSILHNDGLAECNDICKAEQTSSDSSSCRTSNILLCEQINTYLEEKHSDSACQNNKSCDQSSTSSKPENTPSLHTSFCIDLDINTHMTNNENINHLPLTRHFNLNTKSPSKDINEMPSFKHCDKDSSKMGEVSAKISEGTNKALPPNTENLYESWTVDLKPNEVTTDKQREFHTSKTTGEQFIMVCDKENIPLKEKEGSLRNTVTGEMIAEQNTEESYSLPIKTTEDLVNRSGKSSFDLPTMNKKPERTSAYLNLPRIWQGENPTVCASSSKMPLSLKEKLPSQEIKNTQNSRELGETMKKHDAIREQTLVPIHSNRVADTLNTGSINPGPKRNPSEEWNAIARTFYDPSFPTEHVTTECPSGPQQTTSQVLSEVNAAILNASSHSTEEKDVNLQNVFIKTQINNIEKFLYLDRLSLSRKRKYEEDLEKAMTADKAEV